MIEKLELKQGNWEKSDIYVGYVEKAIENIRDNISVAEIGVDIGASAVPVIKLLRNNDSFYYFDLKVKTDELKEDFKKINTNNCKIYDFGNTNLCYDSYSWELMKIYREWKNEGNPMRFDVVYLDGAHTYIHDAIAACMLKEMIKIGGIIIFDDVRWSIESSPTCNPKKNPNVTKQFTQEQIEACQVEYVVDCFMRSDTRFLELDSISKNVAVFKRVD